MLSIMSAPNSSILSGFTFISWGELPPIFCPKVDTNDPLHISRIFMLCSTSIIVTRIGDVPFYRRDRLSIYLDSCRDRLSSNNNEGLIARARATPAIFCPMRLILWPVSSLTFTSPTRFSISRMLLKYCFVFA